MSESVKISFDGGSGKATVFVAGVGQHHTADVSQLAERLSQSGERAVVVEVSGIGSSNWRASCERFLALLNEAKIRQAVFVGVSDGAILVQYLALTELKRVRAMMLIDATARAKESRWIQFIAKLEGFLPLGLPFRQRGEEFDSKPELHRVRCPALIVTSQAADEQLRQQADLLAHGLPTAWRSELTSSNTESNLGSLLASLQTVPNKSPQKRLAG